MIDDAQIGERLRQLTNDTGADLSDLVANYINGTFTFDADTGIITVLPQDLEGLSLFSILFFQSNVDFNISVSVLIRDFAFVGGVLVERFTNQTQNLEIDLVGTADPPTVFAESVSGFSLSRINITLGGESTDADAALGREESETIYYIVSEVENFNMTFDYVVSAKSFQAF